MHTTEVEVAVIGAGVVGLAIGLAASRRGRTVCVLERDDRPGQGASTHNSQVIHAGLHYPPGTLKARHCVEGADRLYAFCRTYNVPYRRCGKLVVASDDSEREALEQLAARGIANGARGIEVVDRAFVRKREPHVHAAAGIYSPDSGVLDAAAFVTVLWGLCAAQGVALLPGTPLLGAETRANGIEVWSPRERILARAVVNAAGLHADTVSATLGAEAFTIHPCRGDYAALAPARRALVNALVYPLPHTDGHGLGVHLSRTVAGDVTLGPTVRFQSEKGDYEGDRLPLEAFLLPARALLPGLTLEDLRPAGSGIRATLHGPEASFADFLIARDRIAPRVVQAAGIESPGLTASLAIGEHAASLVDQIL